MTQETQECCPLFNPEKWDNKEFNWNKKPFIKESMPTFFHIPFPPMIGKKIMKMCETSEKSQKALKKKEDILLLFQDPHAFKSEIFLSVTGKVPSANNVTISGTFHSKVFDGPYNAIPKFMKEMDKYLEEKEKKAKKYYVHYAYCPKCSKEKGHNYMILFAEI